MNLIAKGARWFSAAMRRMKVGYLRMRPFKLVTSVNGAIRRGFKGANKGMQLHLENGHVSLVFKVNDKTFRVLESHYHSISKVAKKFNTGEYNFRRPGFWKHTGLHWHKPTVKPGDHGDFPGDWREYLEWSKSFWWWE